MVEMHEGERDFQEEVGGLQRPAIRKDYGKEAGEILKDLEITREIEAIVGERG